MSGKQRIPVTVPIQPHLADHRFEGKAVFPAVEALQLLARIVEERHPGVEVRFSRDARFLRFLQVPVDADAFDAIVELEPRPEEQVVARLLTQVRAGGTGMARLLEHAVVTFGRAPSSGCAGSQEYLEPASCLAAPLGPGLCIRSTDLYGAMVPFGPAYHNARDPIVLTRDGASGRVVCPDLPYPRGPLGSPFPLDAAFHIACGWGERHVGAVLFPVGYESRTIFRPNEPGGHCFCRVMPRPLGSEVPAATALFDLWIFDREAALREICFGVRMEDVSRGRFVPPDWGLWKGDDPLEPLRADVAGLVVLELSSVLPPLARATLTPGEKALAEGLGERRQPSFIAGRVALKRLARCIAEGPLPDDSQLHTIQEDGIRPICPLGASDQTSRSIRPPLHPLLQQGREEQAFPRFASLAHDRRFAIAVAAERPVGVDVEPVTDKALRGARLFLSRDERRRVEADPSGPDHAATRLWTVKEAVAKALNVRLPKAWHAVEAVELLPESTRLRIDGAQHVARHAECDGHLFTTLLLPGASESNP